MSRTRSLQSKLQRCLWTSKWGERLMASRLPVDLFSLDIPDRMLREAFCGDLEKLLTQTFPNLTASIAAVETEGLPIFEVACQFHLRALMMLSNVDYGYISPHIPHYADFIETLKKYFPEKSGIDYTQGLILLNSSKESVLVLIMALYHWKAYVNGLSGYSETASRLHRITQKRYRSSLPPSFLSGLSTEELYELRARMKREEESLSFLRDTMNRVVIPKNNAQRFAKGQAEG